ncbi:MAG TPA: acyltransferase family protein [Mycobacteriales bacterium]|jgi:peptidoglycan/LPS O-acetylase OafA/YrhL|nr:acyltransferase family protein [Mycobacteriales bacterium]
MTAGTSTRTRGRPPRLAYVPGLDGLRGLAVVAVLLFHGGVSWLPGGFLGVDAFFVLSGYLITTILLSAPPGDGLRAELRSFWERRARRLVPALLALTFVALLAGAVLPLNASPRDALASLAYLANWRFVLTGGGYFGSFGEPSAFKHAWSLAVEGQFYLLWPLLVLGVCRRSRGAVLATAGAGALMSAWAMAASFSPYVDPSRAYYGTDTRIQALFVGSALAVVLLARPAADAARRARRRAYLSASGVLGAGVSLWLWHAATGSTPGLYRGGFLVAAVATAAVIASVVAVPAGPLARALAWAPLRRVGQVSYGVYLWHWPVFLLVTAGRAHVGGALLLLLRVALTAGLTALSWSFVEVPARTWSPRTPGLARRVALAGGAVLLVAGSLAWVRTSPHGSTSLAAAEVADARGAEPSAAPPVAPRGTAAPGAARTAAPGAPAAPAARPGGPARVMFIGDSVAQTLAAGLTDGDGIDVVNEGILGCGLTTGGPYRYFGGQYDDLPQCAGWEATWAAAVRRQRPALVAVLTGRWECMDRKHDGQWMHLGQPAYDAYVTARLDRAVTVLSAGGTRVALLTAPYYKRGERPDGGRFPEDDPARVDRFNELLRGVAARHPGVRVVELNSALAPEGTFTKRINGTLVRYDGVHISAGGARLIRPWLFAKLREAVG